MDFDELLQLKKLDRKRMLAMGLIVIIGLSIVHDSIMDFFISDDNKIIHQLSENAKTDTRTNKFNRMSEFNKQLQSARRIGVII